MTAKKKKIIYDIIFDENLSIEEKFQEIIKIFPDYLDDKEVKKVIYEKTEGIFHDWLWTYFELLIIDGIIDFYSLSQEKIYKESAILKMKNAGSLYKKFFPNNEYGVNFEEEKQNIEKWSKNAMQIIQKMIWNNQIKEVSHSARDFKNGNARDILIKLSSEKEINLSLKTDKSGKVAISDWQTPKIFEKVYNRYFNLKIEDYTQLKNELFWTEDESLIFEDFQNIALLTQRIIIQQFWLIDVEINNFKNAKITNWENLSFLILQLKKFKNGRDNAFVLLVNRLTGEIGFESLLDEISEDEIMMTDFSFTPCIPRWYKYATEPWIKYKWKTFVSFQVKHKRWRRVSQKFWDITIRLRAK